MPSITAILRFMSLIHSRIHLFLRARMFVPTCEGDWGGSKWITRDDLLECKQDLMPGGPESLRSPISIRLPTYARNLRTSCHHRASHSISISKEIFYILLNCAWPCSGPDNLPELPPVKSTDYEWGKEGCWSASFQLLHTPTTVGHGKKFSEHILMHLHRSPDIVTQRPPRI